MSFAALLGKSSTWLAQYRGQQDVDVGIATAAAAAVFGHVAHPVRKWRRQQIAPMAEAPG
jgi:hypothetical protein